MNADNINTGKTGNLNNDLINSVLVNIEGLDHKMMEMAQSRLDNLTKPLGSLGRLESLSRQIAGITGRLDPDITKKLIVIMAADHGVVDEGISAYPREVTPQMVYNFINGGAGINVLSRHVGADVVIVDIGVAADIKIDGLDMSKDGSRKSENILITKKIGYGTGNMAKGPAMTKENAQNSIEAGISVATGMVKKGYGIIGTGDMGIGNTTASSAIATCICRVDAETVTGYGTGIDEKGYRQKVEVIKNAIKINKPDPSDGIDVLSKIGGYEIGGIAGVILGCAAKKVPVVIDGFISGAGALIAELLSPGSRDYMIASHSSVEKGHAIMLEKLALRPLFDFDMRLGEGTGAALGISIVEAAMKILNEMATFGEAGVSGKND